jgi:hypothetical protein
MDEMLDKGDDEPDWDGEGWSEKHVQTEWKYSLNIVAMSCGVLACNLVPGLLVSDLVTELGIFPELYLILKTDQKRFGLICIVFHNDEKNDSLLFWIIFLTSALSLFNFALR